ncbi:MAG TPA: ABC transporter ATP-binding protein [Acidimicrobiales bacterium]|nr:ABC transporter ATP-binding protein [Acidimicrobiales bacterium]
MTTIPTSSPNGAHAADDGDVVMALDHVSAAYGPFKALFDVSFAVREGRSLALIGPNGSGKTTVARVCSGLLAPTSGTLRFEGADVTGERAYKLARRGVAHAPEGRSVFASLTVEENLQLSQLRRSRPEREEALAGAYEMFPRLGERRRQAAGLLSGGEQRMLSLARVMVEKPRLLIADELSLGLAPIIVNEVYDALKVIKAAGTTLVIIEQHTSHALDAADDIVVLVQGHVRVAGPAAELGDLSQVLLPGSAHMGPSA